MVLSANGKQIQNVITGKKYTAKVNIIPTQTEQHHRHLSTSELTNSSKNARVKSSAPNGPSSVSSVSKFDIRHVASDRIIS